MFILPAKFQGLEDYMSRGFEAVAAAHGESCIDPVFLFVASTAFNVHRLDIIP